MSSNIIKHFLQATVIFKIYFPSDYVRRFATEDALRETEKKEDSSDSEISDFSDEDEAKDMELWSPNHDKNLTTTTKSELRYFLKNYV